MIVRDLAGLEGTTRAKKGEGFACGSHKSYLPQKS